MARPALSPAALLAKRLSAFWPRVDQTDPSGCWRWSGPIAPNGYGRHASIWAHRFAYDALVGPIPKGLTVDHLCRNRACVNPAHLEAVTYRENIVRGNANTGRPHLQDTCYRGHPYSQIAKGRRLCDECARVRRNALVPCPDCARSVPKAGLTVHRRRGCPPAKYKNRRQAWLRDELLAA